MPARKAAGRRPEGWAGVQTPREGSQDGRDAVSARGVQARSARHQTRGVGGGGANKRGETLLPRARGVGRGRSNSLSNGPASLGFYLQQKGQPLESLKLRDIGRAFSLRDRSGRCAQSRHKGAQRRRW